MYLIIQNSKYLTNPTGSRFSLELRRPEEKEVRPSGLRKLIDMFDFT